MLPESRRAFEESMHSSTNQLKQLLHISCYELGWHGLLSQTPESLARAAEYFKTMADESQWSKCWYMYLAGVCLWCSGKYSEESSSSSGEREKKLRQGLEMLQQVIICLHPPSGSSHHH